MPTLGKVKKNQQQQKAIQVGLEHIWVGPVKRIPISQLFYVVRHFLQARQLLVRPGWERSDACVITSRGNVNYMCKIDWPFLSNPQRTVFYSISPLLFLSLALSSSHLSLSRSLSLPLTSLSLALSLSSSHLSPWLSPSAASLSSLSLPSVVSTAGFVQKPSVFQKARPDQGKYWIQLISH